MRNLEKFQQELTEDIRTRAREFGIELDSNLKPVVEAEPVISSPEPAAVRGEASPHLERHGGDKVKILSKRGVIESGWVVTDVDDEASVVIVEKEGARRRTKATSMELPLDTLESWQQFSDEETLRAAFTSATTPEALQGAFAENNGLWEGGKFYSSLELTNILEEAMAGRISTNNVPNTAGLRGIVRALITERMPVQSAETPASEAPPVTTENPPKVESPESMERDINEEEFARRLRKVKSFDQFTAVLAGLDNVATKKADFSRGFLEKQLQMARTDKVAKWVPTVGGMRVVVARLLKEESK
jgi:hypothetical protein